MMFSITACQTMEEPTKTEARLQIKWHFHEVIPQELMGCLNTEDVKKLRKYIYRCEENGY